MSVHTTRPGGSQEPTQPVFGYKFRVMIYVLCTILILIIATLLIRVRFRLEISPERRILFVGLGRSGPEFDFIRKEGVFKLFGMPLKRFSLERRPDTVPPKAKPGSVEAEAESPRSSRRRSFGSIITTIPQCLTAFWKFAVGVLRSTIVEQAEAEIEAGFDTPDITGQVYGYYQAALAIAPGVLGRVSFVPSWTGRSFSGSARVSMAWPVYRLLWQTLLLVWRLPIRKIYKLARGEKKGVGDV